MVPTGPTGEHDRDATVRLTFDRIPQGGQKCPGSACSPTAPAICRRGHRRAPAHRSSRSPSGSATRTSLTDVAPGVLGQCRRSSALPETAAPAPGRLRRRLPAPGRGGRRGRGVPQPVVQTVGDDPVGPAAAREVADDIPVRVVDTLSVSFGQGLQVIERGPAWPRRARRLDEVADAAEAAAPRYRVVRRPRHPGEPEEGRADRRGRGPARLHAVHQAGHRGDRRRRRAGVQAAHAGAGRCATWPTRWPRPTGPIRSSNWPSCTATPPTSTLSSPRSSEVVPPDRVLVGWVGAGDRIPRRARGHRPGLVAFSA